MTITPLADRVLVRMPRKAEKTAGGIILPDSARKKADMDELEMEVVKLGETAFVGFHIKPEEGDAVLVARYAGVDRRDIKEDYEYRLVRDDDITALMKDVDIQARMKELKDE